MIYTDKEKNLERTGSRGWIMGKVRGLIQELNRVLAITGGQPELTETFAKFHPLKKTVLSSGVGETLVNGFKKHLSQDRGDEETGWVLLGYREHSKAIVLAALPAGEFRESSQTHVRFNSQAQEIAARLVRQKDNKLVVLGVVHTHPGSMRHPSSGDYRGDVAWVENLAGTEGVFGIGTADGPDSNSPIAKKTNPNTFVLSGVRFTWYSLGAKEANYKPLPLYWSLGPDLAQPLHPAWHLLEKHAKEVNGILLSQNGARCNPFVYEGKPVLSLEIPGVDKDTKVQALVGEQGVNYFVNQHGEMLAVDLNENKVDRGMFLVLAELSK